MEKNIKILATLGPSSFQKSTVQKMDDLGVDIFRINLSHTKIGELAGIIKNLRSWTKKRICLDTEGAQVRTGKIKNNQITLKDNSIISLVSSKIIGNEFNIPLYPIEPKNGLRLGDILFIDFNSVVVQVIQIKKGKVYARVLSGGRVSSNKGVSLDRNLNLPAFTQKDLKVFKLAKRLGLSCFSPSFMSRKKDVNFLRKLFPYPIFIISKIESRQGIKNLEDICRESDAILIDRGDLSREVPLTKIALAQKDIIETAKKLKIPVYTATNLLESMINNFKPTGGEINDITSTLLDGGKGLVLAAETAIGKYPIESVKMAVEIKKEVEKYKTDGKKYFEYMYDYSLIPPHGGFLVQNFIDSSKIEDLNKLPQIEVDEKILSDIVQIAVGTYSPLGGFMDQDELLSVLDNYKLADGTVWTLPIILQLDKKDIFFAKNSTIAFRREKDKKIYAIMKVSNIQKIDVDEIAKKWFGTNDLKHPGVAYFVKGGNYIVSGEVFLLHQPTDGLYSYTLTPRQTREIFKERGWKKIVGFHTRNVIHRGHEFIQKKTLEKINADALFISPVVGPKKPADFIAEAILKTYEIMLENNYYHPFPALLGTFNTYSRYSGPREAVFTALCRKNFGCSHFVIGRDHTGVGNYYSPDASYKIFHKIGDIGMVPLMFNAVYFCKKCNKVTDECNHSQEQKLEISGTAIRKKLLENKNIPEYLMRKDIAKKLQEMYRFSPSRVFEGSMKIIKNN